MSEVTLHGYPVKVGDMVWHFLRGWDTVQAINEELYKKFPIKLSDGAWYTTDSLLWQPIDPDAIEAAKVKPKQMEYSYRWYSDVLDHTSSRMTQFEWNKLYVKQRDDANNWVRIEESKREVRT